MRPLALVLLGLCACAAWAQSDKEPPGTPVPKATITVTSTPVGARVYVGSEGGGAGMFYKGVTPITVTIESAQEEASQRYRVTLTAPEYDSYTRMLEVRRGDALQVDGQMDPRCKRAYVQEGAIVVEGWDGACRKVVAQVGHRFSWERLSWSPNGRYLAYAQMGELFVADVSWRQDRQVTDVAALAAEQGLDAPWVCESPIWSSDCRHLLSVSHCGVASELVLFPVRMTAPDDLPGGEGGGETGALPALSIIDRTGPATASTAGPPIRLGREFSCIDDWRPGERMLAAETQLYTQTATPYSELMLISLDDDFVPLPTAVRLANAGQASWSPDGSRLVYTYFDPATRASVLCLADGNGNAPVAIAQRSGGRIRRPVWSPDGEAVAYLLAESGDGWEEAIHVLSVSKPESDAEVWRTEDGADDEGAIRVLGFTPDGGEVVFSRGAPEASLVYGVAIGGGRPRQLLPQPVACLTYSSGLPASLYRSLSVFRDHLLATLDTIDIGRLSDLCLPVLERVDADGKLVKELWEDQRDAALADILRNVGHSGVANASHLPYTGSDGRFEQVVLLGGSGRKLFLSRSDGRWYVGGFYLSP